MYFWTNKDTRNKFKVLIRNIQKQKKNVSQKAWALWFQFDSFYGLSRVYSIAAVLYVYIGAALTTRTSSRNFMTIDRTGTNSRQEVLLVWFVWMGVRATVCFALCRTLHAGNEADRPAAPYDECTCRISHLPSSSEFSTSFINCI